MRVVLIAIAVVFVLMGQVLAQSEGEFKPSPQQRLDVGYRLFDTRNMWTKLLLDTRTGRVWQVAFTVKKDGVRGKLPINTKILANEKNTSNGRFTLYPTDNMWTFILVDQENGNLWQCQFTLDSDTFRGLLPITEE